MSRAHRARCSWRSAARGPVATCLPGCRRGWQRARNTSPPGPRAIQPCGCYRAPALTRRQLANWQPALDESAWQRAALPTAAFPTVHILLGLTQLVRRIHSPRWKRSWQMQHPPISPLQVRRRSCKQRLQRDHADVRADHARHDGDSRHVAAESNIDRPTMTTGSPEAKHEEPARDGGMGRVGGGDH